MKWKVSITFSSFGITKATVAIVVVVLISAIAAVSYHYVIQLSSQNGSPTPTPSSNPATPDSTPTPIATPTPTKSVSPTPSPTPTSSEPSLQEKIRDSIMSFIKSDHPETTQFIKDLVWTGGRVTPQNILGAETFMYYSSGWNFTLSYPVVPNAIYTIIADYSAVSIGIPYRIIWKGTWKNEVINETNYIFAQ